MSVFEIVLISMGLAMDAFGVSIGKGLSMPVGENGRKVTLAFFIWVVSVSHARYGLAHWAPVYRCNRRLGSLDYLWPSRLFRYRYD